MYDVYDIEDITRYKSSYFTFVIDILGYYNYEQLSLNNLALNCVLLPLGIVQYHITFFNR